MIYLDNAATTQISEPVLKEMLPFLYDQYGNASSAYDLGMKPRKAIEQARKYVAELINAEPEEIYFTSGGSEANNWAIKGTWFSDNPICIGADEIITSNIEHPSVINAVEHIEYYHGAESVFLPVAKDGILQPIPFVTADFDNIFMVSVMFANNEIGTIQPIEKIGKMCREHNVLLHTDAVQAFGQIPIDVKKMNIDMLSASGHKIHAPKGVGCLYIRKGISISPLIHGGHQENGMRAGTENVAAIAGFGEAAYQAKRTMRKRMKKITTVRNYIWERIKRDIDHCFVNGDMVKRLPGNLNITFEGIDGESLVSMLNNCKDPICISAGSACTSGSRTPSHVLKAIGLTDQQAMSTVRLTLDEKLTLDDANYVVDSIKKCVERLRGYGNV